MIATLDLHHELFFDRHCRADLYLHVLGALLADTEVVCFFDVVGDGMIEGIPRAFDRGRGNDATQRNDGDVCRAAADVDDHVPARFMYWDPSTDRGKYWLFHYVRFARTGFCCGLNDRAPLGRAYSRRDRDHHFRTEEVPRPE